MIRSTLIRRTLASLLAAHTLGACNTGGGDDPGPDMGMPSPARVEAEMRSLSLDGGGDSLVAAPGAQIRADLAFQLAIENCDGCAAQVAVGFGEQTACVFDDEQTGEIAADLMLAVPNTPGDYPIRWAIGLDSDCDSVVADLARGETIGEITVEADTPAPNRAPRVAGLDVRPATYATECETRLFAEAEDPDGDPLEISWAVRRADGRAFAEGRGPELVLPGGEAADLIAEVRVEDPAGAAGEASTTLRLAGCEFIDGMVPTADGQRALLYLADPADYATQHQIALQLGGHLATFSTPEEMAFAAGLEAGRGAPWVGLLSPDADGSFRWITGERRPFHPWCDGEPNNAGGFEYAAELWDIECLNDADPRQDRGALVEFELPGGDDDLSAGGDFARPGFPAADSDHTVLRLNETSTVSLAVSDGEGGCEGVGDPMLAIYSNGMMVAANDDSDTHCPRLEVELSAGRHDVVVLGYNDQAVEGFTLTVSDGAPAPAPRPAEFFVAEGDGVCPAGARLATPEEAEASNDAICPTLGEWYIVRLAGGGAMHGPGYGCPVSARHDDPTGHSLCVR